MQIFEHETDIDITHKLNQYELNAWVKHLKHVQKEISSLEKMLEFDVDEELKDKFLLQQLQEKRIENEYLVLFLENHIVAKPNELLCEDFKCDMDIISEHEKHRNKYLKYLAHYRILKNKIYRTLNGKPPVNSEDELKYG